MSATHVEYTGPCPKCGGQLRVMEGVATCWDSCGYELLPEPMTTPLLRPWWWLRRALMWWYPPTRRFAIRVSLWSALKPYGNHNFYRCFLDWLWNGSRKGLAGRVRCILFGQFVQEACPRCGAEGWGEDGWYDQSKDTCHDDVLFECVGHWSYGTQDGTFYEYHGWRWCADCGHRAWERDGT